MDSDYRISKAEVFRSTRFLQNYYFEENRFLSTRHQVYSLPSTRIDSKLLITSNKDTFLTILTNVFENNEATKSHKSPQGRYAILFTERYPRILQNSQLRPSKRAGALDSTSHE